MSAGHRRCIASGQRARRPRRACGIGVLRSRTTSSSFMTVLAPSSPSDRNRSGRGGRGTIWCCCTGLPGLRHRQVDRWRKPHHRHAGPRQGSAHRADASGFPLRTDRRGPRAARRLGRSTGPHRRCRLGGVRRPSRHGLRGRSPATYQLITTVSDLEAAELRLQSSPRSTCGPAKGFDVHAFVEGDHVWLGGDEASLIPGSSAAILTRMSCSTPSPTPCSPRSATATSARTFPPSDMQWKGASSDRFLRHAVERVKARGGIIANINVTIVCEAPRIGPHREAMQRRIAEIAGIAPDRVGHHGRHVGEGWGSPVAKRASWPGVSRRCACRPDGGLIDALG